MIRSGAMRGRGGNGLPCAGSTCVNCKLEPIGSFAVVAGRAFCTGIVKSSGTVNGSVNDDTRPVEGGSAVKVSFLWISGEETSHLARSTNCQSS